jgi:L-lactate dehydrogenase
MAKHLNKVAIIGCGLVGASIAYALSTEGLVSELVLVDINHEKAQGEAMDINHGLVHFTQMEVYAGEYSDIKDADIIIICSGVGRKPGETRLDLAKNNVKIIKAVAESMKPYYTGSVVLMVSNPVDILTYTIKQAMDLPKESVIGTGTVLDTARFKYFLSRELGVDIRNIHGYVIGEHGDSQFPVWSSVNIAGMALDDYCEMNGVKLDMQSVMEQVRNAGAEVIKRKGATYYAIASNVCRIVEAILKNEHAVLPLSTVIPAIPDGKEVAISLPCIVNSRGIEKYLHLKLNQEESKKFRASARVLEDMIQETVK